MPSALVRETELEIIEIAALVDLQLRHIEESRHPFQLLVADRMFHNDNGIVHVASLDEVVREEILDFVEEDECPAGSNLSRIVPGRVPFRCLYPEDSGVEIHGKTIRQVIGRCHLDP